MGDFGVCVGLCWGYVGTSGATLAPLWAHVQPFILKYVVVFVGLFRIRVGTVLGLSWAILALLSCVGTFLATLALYWAQIGHVFRTWACHSR